MHFICGIMWLHPAPRTSQNIRQTLGRRPAPSLPLSLVVGHGMSSIMRQVSSQWPCVNCICLNHVGANTYTWSSEHWWTLCWNMLKRCTDNYIIIAKQQHVLCTFHPSVRQRQQDSSLHWSRLSGVCLKTSEDSWRTMCNFPSKISLASPFLCKNTTGQIAPFLGLPWLEDWEGVAQATT